MSTPRDLTLPSGVTRTEITTERGVFAALSAGAPSASTPSVVLVPGWTGSKEDFAPLLPLIAATGRHAVAIDQRGQQETRGTDDPEAYTLASLADDVLAVAAAVCDRPVDLVGHSLGGLVAAQVTVDAPLRLNTVTLLCSGPGALPVERHGDLRRLGAALRERHAVEVWQAMREHERASGAPMPPAQIETWLRERFLRSHPTSLAAMTEHLLTAPDRTGDLADRPTPVLVLTGELDDGWPVATQQQLAQAVGAQFAVLDGLGHSPAVEDPRRTADHLIDFWQQWRPMAEPVTLTLDGAASEIRRARRAVRGALEPHADAASVDDAELLTSELVTNAVLHARPPVRLVGQVSAEHVVVVVGDAGRGPGGHPRDNHGRGLSIVRAVSQRCGSWVSDSGSTVWFWLPLTPATSTTSLQSQVGVGISPEHA